MQDRDDFKFAHYVVLSSYLSPRQSGKGKVQHTEAVWPKQEEQFYREHAAWACEFGVQRNGLASRWTLLGDMVETGVLMVVPSASIPLVLAKIKASIN